MKKIFHIWLSLLLLISTAGLSVSRHICGDTVMEIAILQQASHCHGEMPMENDGCCDNQTELYQVDDDFQFEKSLQLDDLSDQFQIIISYLATTYGQVSTYTTDFYYEGSPPISGSDILKKIQSFLL
jgi:hypothetical protein